MSIVSTTNREKGDTRIAVIRVNTDDITELSKVFEESGYKMTMEYKIEQ